MHVLELRAIFRLSSTLSCPGILLTNLRALLLIVPVIQLALGLFCAQLSHSTSFHCCIIIFGKLFKLLKSKISMGWTRHIDKETCFIRKIFNPNGRSVGIYMCYIITSSFLTVWLFQDDIHSTSKHLGYGSVYVNCRYCQSLCFVFMCSEDGVSC